MNEQDKIVASASATLGEISRHETSVTSREFHLLADEPHEGSVGVGPTPTEYLLIALASCTAITLRHYADRKYDYAGDITVDVSYHQPRESGAEKYLQRTIRLSREVPRPDLDVMMDIAERTPVTLLLSFAWSVRTDFAIPR